MADDQHLGARTPNRYAELAGFDGGWRDNWWNPDFLELMARRWQLERARRVLDVGSGAGHWGQRLAPVLPSSAEVIGVDAEPSFVERATALAEARGLAGRYRYVQGRGEALPFPDATFDVVTCQTVLIHVPDVRAVLREMLRVVVPGGLLALVEPNNLGSALSDHMGHPRPPWEEVEQLVRFQHHTERGKIALGRGDSSVGELLPGFLAELGVDELQVYSNDRCVALYPPYDRREQQLDLAQFTEWFGQDIWPGAGSPEEALALYVAGGGDAESFERVYPLVLRAQRQFLEHVRTGTYHAARGSICYLVSARRRA